MIKFYLWKYVHHMPEWFIRQWQYIHLQRLVTHARKNVPLYAELYAATDIHIRSSPGYNLTALPIVKRAHFSRSNAPYFTAPKNTWNGTYTWGHTSGTTGTPRAVLRSCYWFERIRNRFFAFKLWRCLDWQRTHPSVTSRSAHILQLHEEPEFSHPEHPHIPFSHFRVYPEKALSELEDVRPNVIQGYTSQLLTIAKLVRKYRKQNVPPIQFAILGGESLTTDQRDFIQQTLGCEVYHRYGLEEFYWAVASECAEHRGMHPHCENYIIEVVDEHGERAQPNQRGKIVITDLFNYATPLIRYDTGDEGYMIPESCPCGLPGDRITVSGRDKVIRNGDKILHYDELNHLTPKLTGRVLQWQIVKKAENDFEVCIVPDRLFTKEVEKMFGDVIHRSFEEVVVTFSYHDIISPGESGKAPFFTDCTARE